MYNKYISKNYIMAVLAALVLSAGSAAIVNAEEGKDWEKEKIVEYDGEISSIETDKGEWQTDIVYEGKNIEAQNYFKWSSPIKSYLIPCSDNNWMRVQIGEHINGVLVEYYDSSYHLVSEKTKIIPEELPIFGGFYETDQYYFLLTGQENKEESAEVEVYRLTKYDKNWNKKDEVGLKDCNTIVPFAFGSARMDQAGDYLLIRTCQQMYKMEDGLNHQANMTIQINIEKENMEITDFCAYHKMLWSITEYVGHSFNQFIKVEDNHIIAVDHGDAYPRSIVLCEYQTDVSAGKFVPHNNSEKCERMDVLSFPGEIGENSTGASIGGFEISDSSYLIAGNSVVQDENNLSRATRNVFIASVDKVTKEVTMHWLTHYGETDGTTSTPHFMQLSRNEYIVLWTREDQIYYTKVDQQGESISEVYKMEGNLSDCVPAVENHKLVWYTWENETILFYEIDLDDLSQNYVKVILNGEHNKPEQPDNNNPPNEESKYEVTVNHGIANGTFEAGSIITIIADIPKEGEQFKNWIVVEGNITLENSSNTTTTFVMPQGKVVLEAVYEAATTELPTPTYTVTVKNGTGSGNYAEGAIVTIQADSPENGMEFQKWNVLSGSAILVDSTKKSTQFVMPKEAIIVEAVFKKVTGNNNNSNNNNSNQNSSSSSSHGSDRKSSSFQSVYQAGIQSSGLGKKFWKTNGTAAKNEWIKYQNIWYYAGADELLKVGWLQLSGKWYYLLKSCAMATDWQFVNGRWYYLDTVNGDMKTDWQWINGKWYYFDPANGDMKTSWIYWNNHWYYLDVKNGDCLINTVTPDGYIVDENGAWIP